MLRASCLALIAFAASVSAGPIYDYVHTPDAHYSYFDTGFRYNFTHSTGYLLNMTSQQWLDSSKIDRYIWTHQLVVIVPDTLKSTDTAGMYITGGGNDNPHPPKSDDEDILLAAILAEELGIVSATLFQVPNAPVVFTSDPTHAGRGEDSLVAYSWHEFLGDLSFPEWNVYFAMVKSAVRGLDTITDFMKKKDSSTNISKFFLHGASKRGWTTWLTSGVDDRVEAMAPIVMDMLNFTENVKHMYRSYGGWTFAFKDYWNENITQDLAHPGMIEPLSAIVDPLFYKENLTMPKIVVDATGDEFFMPDDDWYWWGDLPGETYRLMIANAEHSMATGLPTLIPGIAAFYESVLVGMKRPEFTWTMDHSAGTITIVTDTEPTRVTMRSATTWDDKRRDFRLIKGDTPADPCKFIPVKIFGTACVNPVLWAGQDVGPTSVVDGKYTYELYSPRPPTGKWRGFLGELRFPGPNGKEFILTTQISIWPDTYPFEDCSTPAQCKGVLV